MTEELTVFTPTEKTYEIAPGKTRWKSPSNIALVKYWGKKPHQIPENPSISFTLQNAYTETQIDWEEKTQSEGEIPLEFYFEGEKNPAFENRIQKFLTAISDYFPFLTRLKLKIASRNTFPHSSGIASSASAMSALAMCLVDMEQIFLKNSGHLPLDREFFFKKASFISRLGSGSASRSVFPEVAVWGGCDIPGSDDLFAVDLSKNLHKEFKGYRDDIIIVDREKKSVSSSAGHSLMKDHIYSGVRYNHAKQNVNRLDAILQSGDLCDFIDMVEFEALNLHSLMMTSNPGFILIKPNTLQIINKIREYRQDTSIPVCFTLDAGPNVHILYPDRHAHTVKTFIQEELLCYSQGEYWIEDCMGQGPKKISTE
ncbi:diphosphomevalonate/mevalonate 3,5-bisphosphate decarboxylase family protein [Membranihabitans maritimus]|uniref:diphosphomevalonate/mevalonate 3,5-bisphosphate decarboxylase family protein n=1 Tax=Membranihabitans maritimus TaxID=2904244 RepID=UPI001F474A08|nr:diphosphomevalonate decarboxylase [Membranihabitans maritimus]